MDLFFHLSITAQRKLFCFDEKSTSELYAYIHSLGSMESDDFVSISKYGLSKLSVGTVPFEPILNPFESWRRCRTSTVFKNGSRRTRVPRGAFKKSLDPNTAYIVDGFSTEGAYARVKTLVIYQQCATVVKMFELDEFDWFELVTHAYMYEQCQKYACIRVPRLLFLQRSRSYGTYACMERVHGDPLFRFKGIRLLVALAHVMKAMHQLQKGVHFMHRDLSGQNVYFDMSTHVVTLIDFGMSWLNPNTHQHAWQNDDDTFYNWRTATKMNRSLDASILIAHLSLRDSWLAQLHVEMKRDYKKAIEESNDDEAIGALSPPRRYSQYTTIRQGPWHVGNELEPWDTETSSGDGPHWWLFNMSSFQVEQWLPENVLKRVLRKLPLDHWFAIRRHWQETFDSIMPKNVQILLDDGRVGTLEKLIRRKLQIRIGNSICTVLPSKCQQITDCGI